MVLYAKAQFASEFKFPAQRFFQKLKDTLSLLLFNQETQSCVTKLPYLNLYLVSRQNTESYHLIGHKRCSEPARLMLMCITQKAKDQNCLTSQTLALSFCLLEHHSRLVFLWLFIDYAKVWCLQKVYELLLSSPNFKKTDNNRSIDKHH